MSSSVQLPRQIETAKQQRFRLLGVIAQQPRFTLGRLCGQGEICGRCRSLFVEATSGGKPSLTRRVVIQPLTSQVGNKSTARHASGRDGVASLPTAASTLASPRWPARCRQAAATASHRHRSIRTASARCPSLAHSPLQTASRHDRVHWEQR